MKTLFTNAKVRLGRNNFCEAAGFDSESGKIIFTGSSDEAKHLKKEFENVIDLKKRLVMPAFTDGHCHFIEGAFISSQLNLRNAKTGKDFISGIRAYRSEYNGTWIFGGFFSEANFIEEIIIDKDFLDVICSDVPVIISRFDTHSAFANSKAIELSGLASAENNFTPDELIRQDGILTGELKERAMDFVLDSIPFATIEERTGAAIKQVEKFNSYGITAISDITLTEDLEIYQELIKRKKLSLRVDARLPFRELYNIEKYKNEFAEISDSIKFNSLKAFYDGSLSSKTALMHSPYKNSNHNGIKTESVISGEFERLAFEIDQKGYQMSVHAIGDKAVTELLELNEELVKKSGMKDRRFRIEHAQHIRENDFERFKDLNVIASVQPSHLFSDAKTAFGILEDYKLEHNYKKLFDIGATVCFGTDFPVVSENPFETIHFAMTRKVQGFENGFATENCISLDDCLDAYTINNAFASFDEALRGKIETGKFADIVVLENDLYEMNEDEIRNSKVNMTYHKGKRVF